jgi:CRP/FNR family transcriptional regulator, cyclic AMP receptor protein
MNRALSSLTLVRGPIEQDVLQAKLTLLATQNVFRDLGRRELAALAGIGRARVWQAGVMIFQRGDRGGRDLILISSGRVRLSVLSMEGRELSLRHVSGGGMIGELAVLGCMDRTADATAVTEVTALVIPGADLDRVLEQHPAILRAFVRFLCERLRSTTDQLEAIALYSLEARLARLLLGFQPDGGAPQFALRLPYTQSEIADLIGASRPKVNQAFARLEDAGAIRRRQGQIICDTALLTDCADGAV